MSNSMSKRPTQDFSQDHTSKCLQKESSREKKSRTGSTFEGSFHKKQKVTRENWPIPKAIMAM
jgi:hypothetical protein